MLIHFIPFVYRNNPETKKGKQLTSIIDQLTINKTKDSGQSDVSQKKALDYKPKQSSTQQSGQLGKWQFITGII